MKQTVRQLASLKDVKSNKTLFIETKIYFIYRKLEFSSISNFVVESIFFIFFVLAFLRHAILEAIIVANQSVMLR